ncbi:unnamed protein product [Prorocentrum cordatum]|uniref:Uncharacterized protein n=1 Tax=Prorocentrum cordatum TaxID=2364126 RepID=A0ABN9TKN0_9DINO|nr:unnamed protein product [Polarella glacialis]
MGRESRCEPTGIGLEVGTCDDPFCRNGGAIRGDGKYCHRSQVVSCTGDAAPRIVDACADRRQYLFEDCYSVQKRECMEYTDTDIRCAGSHSHLEGNGCYDGRRRRSW